jgi:hypothetical protein
MAKRRSRSVRQQFIGGLIAGLRVVWPILSAIILLVVLLGGIVGMLEEWSLTESIYFAFVSGLTIGYGDLSPATGMGRVLSVAIGLCGVLFTALLAAVAVKALGAVADDSGT